MKVQICLDFLYRLFIFIIMKKISYINRTIETILKKLIKQFSAVAVTGPRQSGKSTLLENLFPDYKYITFDDILTRQQAAQDPNLFLDEAGENVILDEIQYVPELLSYIKIRIDNNRNKKGLYIFTGSQQFHLIKNLGDSLAGRIGLLTLLPFSLSEQINIPFLKPLVSDNTNQFVYSCLNGNFPEINTDKSININTWYSSYLQTYIERDIRTIYNIGNLRAFQQFLQVLAANCSTILNLTSLSQNIGISINTIKRWISVLEASRIIYLLPPYYNNFQKRITKAPKIYFIDSGLVCYLTGLKEKEHLLKGPMAGRLFENYCIQESLKVIFNKGISPRLYYLRTHNQTEVDLILEKDHFTVYPFEIKLTKTPNRKMAANIENYIKLFPKLKINKGSIISLSEKTFPLTRNVNVTCLDSYLKWLEKVI